MNTITNTQPAYSGKDDPFHRPSSSVKLNDDNRYVGNIPRPLLLIGREATLKPMSLNACRLFDAMLAITWETLETAQPSTYFCTKGSFLRRQIGQSNRRSNDRLDAAFDELATSSHRLPSALGSPEFCETTLVKDWAKGGGIHSWRFPAEVVALCQHVPLWIKYPIGTAFSLQQPLAHRLHELLSVFAGRQWPIWTVPITELRRLLGCTKPDMSDRTFLREQLRPALIAVARARGWPIHVDLLPDPRILPPHAIRFTIHKSQTATTAEAA